ncbi:MAG: S8 family serine peptidase [Chloroflexi bacterium]|nr:S8 family serine peptidase [Chloroflexota bacterium]
MRAWVRVLGSLAVIAVVATALVLPGPATSVASADEGFTSIQAGSGGNSHVSYTHVVVKLKSGATIEWLLQKISTWSYGSGSDSKYYSAVVEKQFPGTRIYLLRVTSGDAGALAKRLPAQKAQVEWAEAGIFAPTSETVRFQQAAFERFSAAAYERFSAAAYERFQQAAYERFSAAAYERFQQAAFERFSAAVYERFSQALYEQFRQAAYERFAQALYEEFGDAAAERFTAAAYERFTAAAYERFQLAAYEAFLAAVQEPFRQAVYEGFTQVSYERFNQAVYERFLQAVYERFMQAAFDAFGEAAFDRFAQAVFEEFLAGSTLSFDEADLEPFRQAVYERFAQAVYEDFSLAIAELLEDPDFNLALQQLLIDLLNALHAEQLARARDQYGIALIHALEAQGYATGSGVTVAVIDTGVYANHWLVADAIAPGGIDLVDGDNDPSDVGDGIDNNRNGYTDEGVGHGTFIAGLIHLVAPDAKILPIRAQNSEGDGWSFLVAEGIYQAVQKGAKVINLSLSIPESSTVLQEAIKDAQRSGAVIVAAAGNDGQKLALFPASYDNVIGVAAVGADSKKADFSNYGNRGVAVAAPGIDVYGPYPVRGTTGMAYWSGTSFATAFATGEAALVSQVNGGRNASRQTIHDVLSTATDLGDVDPVYGDELGSGLLNALAAVRN